IRCLDEAILVHTAISRQTTNQTNVRPFWGLDGADAPIVTMVNVAYLEAGPLAAQTTRTQCRERALVRQLGQGVGLFHELAKLRATEEFTNGSNDGANVDQRYRRQVILVANRHALAHHTFHTAQPNAQLGLQQLAYGLYAAVAKVINIVRTFLTVVDQDHVPHEVYNVVLC